MKLRTIGLGLFTMTLSSLVPSRVTASFPIGLSTMIIERTVSAGGTQVFDIDVTNLSQTDPVVVTLDKQDWQYEGKTRQNVTHAPGTGKRSCAEWMELEGTSLSLAPGQTRAVRVGLRVPADAEGGFYSALGFAARAADQKPSMDMKVETTIKLSTLFLIEIKGKTKANAEAKDLAIQSLDENTPVTFNFGFQNTGNVRVASKGTINVLNAQNQSIGWVETQELRTLPGDEMAVGADWSGQLEEGDYIAVLTIPLRGGDVIVAEKPFRVEKKLKLDNLVANSNGPSTILLSAATTNEGYFNVETTGVYQLVDARSGDVRSEGRFASALVRSGATHCFEARIPRPSEAGSYIIKARMEGANGAIEKELDLDIQ